jgi:alkylation response protein AidB-like acyl-CoA dehydrogenase
MATWTGPTPVAGRLGADGGLVLDGRASLVEAGAQAAHLLVTVADEEGVGLALVAADGPGVAVEPLDGLDLVRRFATVTFDGAAAEPLGGPDDVERALQVACALQCAEVVGAVGAVFATTLEYLGDRYSFGRPLASYQALKHRVADDDMALEACRATATAATRAVAAEAPDAGELVSAAKHWIGRHASEIVQDCVQLHGGIGVTWEHDLHLYLRRVTVDRATYGTPEDHGERLATRLLGAAS